jgi:hypothetical protein
VTEEPKEPCIGNDPLCPCQDGDMCHYKGPGAWKLPTHCCDCGALLMGSLTEHKEGCRILAVILEHFPNWRQPNK